MTTTPKLHWHPIREGIMIHSHTLHTHSARRRMIAAGHTVGACICGR